MIAKFLYKNPQILWLVVVFILVSGAACFYVIPRLEDPVLSKRVAVISIAFPGADAQRVEAQVTIRIEELLRGITELEEIRSNSRAGISNIVLELNDLVEDVDEVWSQVRSRLDEARTVIPESCSDPVFEVFPLKAYAAIIAVKPRNADVPVDSILRKLARKLQDRIENLSGTEAVHRYGDPGEEFIAEIEPAVLAGLGVPIGAIAEQVSEGSVTQPAGVVRSGNASFPLDVTDRRLPIQDLGERVIRVRPTETPLRLTSIASVAKNLVDPATDWASVDGSTAIVLGVFVDDRIRVDHWSESLDILLSKFQDEYSAEVQIDTIFSQHEFIDSRLKQLIRNLLMGAAAVTGVVLLMMGWRCMLVVAVSLPLSSMMVLGGMRALDIPLHQMSVTGLIVALGLLIDNAIVIVEDVRSRIVEGASPARALTLGVRHLAMPLFGSTLTTALAFTPIATLPGPPGEFVGTIAMSVILAIASSFILAMTVLPAMLALLKIDPKSRGLLTYGISSRLLSRLYEWTLRVVFRFPVLGILLGVALPTTGFVLAQQLPEQFFPPSDRRQIQIEVELPAREPIDKTIETVKTVESLVVEHEAVRRSHWFIGRSAPTFYYNVVARRRGTPFYAQSIVELQAGSNIGEIVRTLQETVDQSNLDCRVIVRQLEQGPPFDAPVELRVQGPDLQILQRLGSDLRVVLGQTSNVIHTRSDVEETIPKLLVKVDQQKLALTGMSESEVAGLLYTTLDGAPAGTILDGEEDLPVRVRMAGGGENRLDRLASISLPVQAARPVESPGSIPRSGPRAVPLTAVADLELSANLANIVRVNGERTNEIKAYIRAGVLPSTVVAEFRRNLEESDFFLPTGYSLSYKGEAAERTHAVTSLMANAVVLFGLMMLTLVISFRSFLSALVIMIVGGLAIGLGPLALWYFGFPFGFMAIVGTMGLVGIAINDSIIVLAGIQESQAAHQGDVNALVKVVSGCTRHVLATTITTIVGFTPLILGGGHFWPPLAISIAGGVAGSTFLALYMVPSLSRLSSLMTTKRSS